jgi:hypothetical protein
LVWCDGIKGVVNKLDKSQRLALVEYQSINEEDKSDVRREVWFRIDDQMRSLQPSEPFDMEPLVTCPILWIRAFFAACAPDVLVYLLQVAAVTAFSPSAMVTASPVAGHRPKEWIFAADTPHAKAMLIEEDV